jgi:hypothetical protein
VADADDQDLADLDDDSDGTTTEREKKPRDDRNDMQLQRALAVLKAKV